MDTNKANNCEDKVDEQGLSKNELKRIAKQKLKDEEKQKKLEEKLKAAENTATKEGEEKQGPVEILDPTEYYDNRCKLIKELKKQPENFPYPHKFSVSHGAKSLKDTFVPLCKTNGEFLPEEVSTAGRVTTIRRSGKNLIFYDIDSEETKVQIMANASSYKDKDHFEHVKNTINRGDIIGINGTVGLSKTGEFTLLATKITLLSPCLHMLPNVHSKLTDTETRYRKRYLDLIVNSRTREIFRTRSQILALLRKELTGRGFLEVETPVLNIIAGGANAKPFETYHNDLHQKMSLRVAPELFLKNCIVGGLDKVFEIGKNFRNEGIDQTHNPEFTACELYWAYADYKDLMTFTEEVLSKIVFEIKGTYIFQVQNEKKEDITIDFTPPFRRINMMEELEKVLDVKIPIHDLESDSTNKLFDDLCVKHKVPCAAPRTTSRLIDKLVGEFIEPSCINPTFLCEQPQLMCPLAKYHRSKPGLTERFEMFINKKEFVNAYTELNDPFVQKETFEEQVKNREKGDEEANQIDYEFIRCLEHALPPTGGWGLGIDRFIMLLTNSYNIQEVILFPAMRPLNQIAEENTK